MRVGCVFAYNALCTVYRGITQRFNKALVVVMQSVLILGTRVS